MYQRLGKWLRILGYDARIDPSYVDQDFIYWAKLEDRILLTRDEDLTRRAKKLGVVVFAVDAPTIEERLVKLAKMAGIELSFPTDILPRCTLCNSKIKPIQKKLIADRLPEGTKSHYDEFWICCNADCNQIYWKGSHWEEMKKSLITCQQLLKTGATIPKDEEGRQA